MSGVVRIRSRVGFSLEFCTNWFGLLRPSTLTQVALDGCFG